MDPASRDALDALVAAGTTPTAADLKALGGLTTAALDELLRSFASQHGARAIPVLKGLGAEPAGGPLRRAARRALYRLAQRGLREPDPTPLRPVVERRPERAVRAWVSGIDGSGSRAAWILFEGSYGALRLCSLILNDAAGILEAAGGAVTKKRLDRELAALRAAQKLPWVEIDPDRAVGLVAEALILHHEGGTLPPGEFERWRALFEGAPPPEPPPLGKADPLLVERATALLELPELAGWFFDPDGVRAEGLELLELRETRLVVSDQLKAERQEDVVSRVVEREMTPDARRRWSRRLGEMALIFAASDRAEHAALARAAGAALGDETQEVRRHPLARGLARRALELAGEVALGRLTTAEVSRAPKRPHDH